MSKYLVFDDVIFRNRALLLAALKDLGYPEVESGDHLPLYGYQGDRRPQTAELVIRRQHIGPASNDLGFRGTPDGYVPIVSEYDVRTLAGGHFLAKLRTAYSEHVVQEVTRRLHGTARRTVEGSLIKITVRY